METLKVVTETTITTTTTSTIEEKYKVLAPESMQETFMSDSEDEGGKIKFLYLIINKLQTNKIVYILLLTNGIYKIKWWAVLRTHNV